MLPCCHCTNYNATHLPLTSYVTWLHLHYLNGPNDVSRHVIWAYGNYSIFMLFNFATDPAMSPPHQQWCYPPPTHFLCHPALPSPFKRPKKCAGHIIWALGICFLFLFYLFFNWSAHSPTRHAHPRGSNDTLYHIIWA